MRMPTELPITNNAAAGPVESTSASRSSATPNNEYVQRCSRIRICGVPVSAGFTQADVLQHMFGGSLHDKPIIATFINPLAFHIAAKNAEYVEMLERFNLILPDGIGIVLGMRLLGDRWTERLSFDSTSLALPVLQRAGLEGRSVMLIGGGPGVCIRAKDQLMDAVPRLHICGVMDGFRPVSEYDTVVRRIRPDIIICGMGAPRQEALLLTLKKVGAWRGLGFTCGGYLDQLQRRLHYYPAVIDDLNLRWFYRLVKEPRRLGARYMLDYQRYLYALMRQLLQPNGTGR